MTRCWCEALAHEVETLDDAEAHATVRPPAREKQKTIENCRDGGDDYMGGAYMGRAHKEERSVATLASFDIFKTCDGVILLPTSWCGADPFVEDPSIHDDTHTHTHTLP